MKTSTLRLAEAIYFPQFYLNLYTITISPNIHDFITIKVPPQTPKLSPYSTTHFLNSRHLIMHMYKSAILVVLTKCLIFITISCALPHSPIHANSVVISYSIRHVQATPHQRSYYLAKRHTRRTGISCYKLGNVLFRPKIYAALVQTVQWNGFTEDHACCSKHSKNTLYCAETGEPPTMVQLKWMWFKKFCVRGRRQLSYTVVPWIASGVREVCVLMRMPRRKHHNVSIRRLHGRDRRPKAAVFNFRNASEASTLSRTQALRGLRKLRRLRGFHAISGSEQRILTNAHRFSSGRVYTIIFNFNSLYFMEH